MKSIVLATMFVVIALCGCNSNNADLAKAKADADAARAEAARLKFEMERGKFNQPTQQPPGNLGPDTGKNPQPKIAPFPQPTGDAKTRRRQEFDQSVRREVAGILPDATWKVESVKLLSDQGGFLEGIGRLGPAPKITITAISGGMTAKASSEEVKPLGSNSPGRQVITAQLFYQPPGSRDTQLLFIDECTTPREKVARTGKSFAAEQTYLTFLRALARIVKKHEDRYLDFLK